MGLLKVGRPLPWSEFGKHRAYVREHGLRQFLATYGRWKDIANDNLFYGDEVEYSIVKLDHGTRKARLSLRSAEVLELLRQREKENDGPTVGSCTWHQEYGSWMLEGTPAVPYGGYTMSLVQVETNMRLRRARIMRALADDEVAPTMVNFPLMGTSDFVHPEAPPGGPSSESDYVPDACINQHPRFGTLTANIRKRRGSKVDIRVPMFKEEADGAVPSEPQRSIHMDCMAFGMGCCCLQVTFQASDVDESRYLYDQLGALAPILLALTASTPIYKGYLSDVDVRWSVVAGAVDDRTPVERGETTDGPGKYLSKSRYDSISCYIQNLPEPRASHYNDIPCEVDPDLKSMLLTEGIDEALAHHLAHLFIRDPLVIFEGSVEEIDDDKSVEHFDNINSTNWQTVRWKLPPPKTPCGPHIGWRTECRPMEVQLTDFENAAFTAFVVLMTRVLLVFDLDLLIPLSKVDENMKRAHSRDASRQGKFWFRTCIIPPDEESQESVPGLCASKGDSKDAVECDEMTMDEIINGKDACFAGLVPLCNAYLEHIQCDATSYARLSQYLHLISQRAAGKLMTPASWMRQFVRSHPEYQKDSKVTDGIAYDLVQACDEIGKGIRPCPELHGDIRIEPISAVNPYNTKLLSSSSNEARAALIRQILARASDEDAALSKPSAPMRRTSSR